MLKQIVWNIYNKRKVVNHNVKTHKNYANKILKIVCLNIFFVFISFCWRPIVEFCFFYVILFKLWSKIDYSSLEDVRTICLFIFFLNELSEIE